MAATVHAPEIRSSRGRRIAFQVVAGLLALAAAVFGGGLPALIGGWFAGGDAAIHRLHDVGWGAFMGLIVTVGFAAQAIRPSEAIATWWQVAAAAGAMVGAVVIADSVDPIPLTSVVVLTVLALLHPRRSKLFSPPERVNAKLAAFAVAGGIPLALYAVAQAGIERAAGPADPHAMHWAGMGALALAIPLVALAAAMQGPGWRVPAWSAGLAAIVLGAASVAFGGYASSLGVAWGIVAIVGGLAFIGLAELEAHRLAGPPADQQSS